MSCALACQPVGSSPAAGSAGERHASVGHDLLGRGQIVGHVAQEDAPPVDLVRDVQQLAAGHGKALRPLGRPEGDGAALAPRPRDPVGAGARTRRTRPRSGVP